MLPYALVLVLSGFAIAAAERFWPLRRQPILRPGFSLDLCYIFLNTQIVGSLIALWLSGLISSATLLRWRQAAGLETIENWPAAWQLFVLFLSKDFLQWSIHYAMHRIPVLWKFHRVHHSSETLDWLSNWRFHWVEILVYQTVLYLPANLAGFSPTATFACAVLSTVLGHFAHANLRWRLGPLKYIFNCPELHWWHHSDPALGHPNRNFAIGLSIWDWLFGTAYADPRPPAKLGLGDSASASLKP
jgi:sterol desaturase/sphingolipid hydroxylase (fatty acid hydroxylase superfamily)